VPSGSRQRTEGGDRDIERQRQRETKTERLRDRDRVKETEGQRQRVRHRQRDRDKETETETETERSKSSRTDSVFTQSTPATMMCHRVLMRPIQCIMSTKHSSNLLPQSSCARDKKSHSHLSFHFVRGNGEINQQPMIMIGLIDHSHEWKF